MSVVFLTQPYSRVEFKSMSDTGTTFHMSCMYIIFCIVSMIKALGFEYNYTIPLYGKGHKS